MTTRLLSALLFAGCVLSAPPKQKNPQKFGHLLIQVTGLKTAQSSVARHHVVIVKVKSKNIGTKMALCAAFTATLKAEFGLEEPSLPGRWMRGHRKSLGSFQMKKPKGPSDFS